VRSKANAPYALRTETWFKEDHVGDWIYDSDREIWRFVGDMDHLASGYGDNSPSDDVAETFVWLIHGNSSPGYRGYNIPSDVRVHEIYLVVDNAGR
jgi:hypothetical protein